MHLQLTDANVYETIVLRGFVPPGTEKMSMKMLCCRMPRPLLERLAAIADAAPASSRPELNTLRNRSDVARVALARGIASLEQGLEK